MGWIQRRPTIDPTQRSIELLGPCGSLGEPPPPWKIRVHFLFIHGSVENGSLQYLFPFSFLSLRLVFHFHDCGRKSKLNPCFLRIQSQWKRGLHCFYRGVVYTLQWERKKLTSDLQLKHLYGLVDVLVSKVTFIYISPPAGVLGEDDVQNFTKYIY